MKSKIALIQIMIHYLTNREVVIVPPKDIRELAILENLYAKALAWGKAVNLKIH